MNEKTGKKDGVVIFYVIYIGFFFIEGAINRGLHYAADHWLHISGFLLAWILFIIGGSLLAFLTLWRTEVQQAFHDPILYSAYWLWRRLGWFGFVLDSVYTAALGVAIVLKADNYPNRVALSVVAATIFASVWVPIYTFLWH